MRKLILTTCAVAMCATPALAGTVRAGTVVPVAADDALCTPQSAIRSIGYYLRSPLLSWFFGGVPCPVAEQAEAAAEPAACVELGVRGRDGAGTLELELPQLGATSAASLRAVIAEHATRGEPVLLHASAHGELVFDAEAISHVVERACR